MAGFDPSITAICAKSGKYRIESSYFTGYWIYLRGHRKSPQTKGKDKADHVKDPEIVASQSNEILTAVVQGARKEETNTDVQMAAMNALYNSLEFIRDNFEREVSSAIPATGAS
jgi:transcriptional/translational regulatory protein YebC/TACO1